MRRLRTTFALTGALIAAVLIAIPAGAFEEGSSSGNTGFYTVPDSNGSPGVRCTFENNGGVQNDELNRVRIKRVFTHGPFSQKTWVGFRFLIKRNTPPFDDGVFRTVFRSQVRKAKANDSEVAYFRGRWDAPEGTNSQFRVHLQFFYYAQGSQTQVIGRVQGVEEVYRHRMTGEVAYNVGSEGDAGYCRHNFNPS